MKAVICTEYGPPEVLQLQEMARPVPKPDQVLVRIIATAVNSGDVRVRGLVVGGFMRIVMRFVLGFSRPRKPVLGTVYAGVVEEVGAEVTGLTVGDEVYGLTGFKFGTYAEFVVVNGKSVIVKKPRNARFEEAAAICFGGQTAYYFLEKAGISTRVRPRVLIYGATGSVGTAAVQIARFHQAEVTAVCGEAGEELVRSLGADRIVLYNREDYTHLPDKFDIIFDAVGKISRKACAHLLKEGGVFKSVASLDVAAEDRKQLDFLRDLFERGKFKATIDKVFRLDQVVEAHRYVDTGRKKGNVVLKVGSER